MNITLVLGTARKGRQSEKVFEVVNEVLEESDNTVIKVDVRDFPFAYTEEENEASKRWGEIANKTDAFVVVVPEYNRNMPGEFKLLWDSCFDEYKGKPIGIITVSSGQFGGTRMLPSIFQMCIACGMHIVPTTVAVPKVEKVFDEEKTKGRERLDKNIREMFKELLQLVSLRNN